MGAGRRAAFALIVIGLLVILAEAGAALTLRLIIARQAAFLLWDPDPARIAAAAAKDEAVADPQIGWPSPRELTEPPRDRTGAKLNTDFPEPENACLSVYGDSFVWGAEIPLMDGWVEQLARSLRCRVANYGVPGYGNDQALIRFRRQTGDEAPVVLFGIFPENLMRNVNHYRGLLFAAGPDRAWLKGRFVLDRDGRLAWIERPRLDAKGFLRLHEAPAEILPHEYFLPGSRDGPVTLQLPHLVTLMRVATMPRLRTRLTGRPSWSEFFDPGHPSGALVLTAALAESFAREAIGRRKQPLVVVLPSAGSFRGRSASGSSEYAPLVALLSSRGVAIFDPAQALLAALGSRSYCALYSSPETCEGHFGVEGGRLVADAVRAELARRNLLPPSER